MEFMRRSLITMLSKLDQWCVTYNLHMHTMRRSRNCLLIFRYYHTGMKKSTKIPKASKIGMPVTVEWKRLRSSRQEATVAVAPTPVPPTKKRKLQHAHDPTQPKTNCPDTPLEDPHPQEKQKSSTVSALHCG